MLNEQQGCEVLARCFRGAGLEIHENFRFQEQGVDVSLDGWDPARRVGYEFVTTEAGDRAEFTPHVVTAIEKRMLEGELFVLLVDEQEIMNEAALTDAAESFLAHVRGRVSRDRQKPSGPGAC